MILTQWFFRTAKLYAGKKFHYNTANLLIAVWAAEIYNKKPYTKILKSYVLSQNTMRIFCNSLALSGQWVVETSVLL